MSYSLLPNHCSPNLPTMHLHRRDRAIIEGNIKLEIIHESNPYFAGEPICLLIRLKHLGSEQQRETIKKKIDALEQRRRELIDSLNNDNESKPWLVKTLWNTFHQEERFKDESLQSQIDGLKKKLEFHEAVDLMSCFMQIVGQCAMDDDVIHMDSLSVGSKGPQLVGIGSQNTQSGEDDPLTSIVSSFFNTNLDEESLKASPLMSTETIDTKDWIKVPFLLIPQTLLFSELLLQPGETGVFKFNTERLRKDLPPSYTNSAHFNISYITQLGISINDPNEIPHQHFFNFPITIYPYVDKNICQYEMPLNRELTISSPGKVQDMGNSVRYTKNRKRTMQSTQIEEDIRRRSISMIGKTSGPSIESMKNKFKEVVSKWDEKEDPELAMNSLLEHQFEKEQPASVRVNLAQFFFEGKHDLESLTEDPDSKLLSQLHSLQKEYVVKMNEKFICNLELSKPVYSIIDQIDLTLDFESPENDPSFKVTAVTACIETFELINPKFSTEQNVSKKKPNGTLIYESHATNFDECKRISMKLMPQCSPTTMITSQFKTDIFQLKWMLTFKFVMIPISSEKEEYFLDKTYEDKKGTLYHAKKDIEGYNFVFHVPLNVLPTEKQLAGW